MRQVFLKNDLISLVLIEESDLESVQQGANNTEVTQFLHIGHMPLSQQNEREWIQKLYTNEHELVLGIYHSEMEKLIGSIGLHRISPRDQTASLGIVLYDLSYCGKGIGTSAIMLLCDHGFRRMNLRCIRLSVLANNPRGIACYKKCGFVEVGTLPKWVFKEGRFHDEIFMVKLREG